MFGLLNLAKPQGVTSRDVVNAVQRLVPRKVKVGHAGTLDPLARGVLLVCLGPANKLVQQLHQLPKSYRAEFRLGCVSDTDDITGIVQPFSDASTPGLEEVEESLAAFRGRITQVPPQYSAVKLQGRRAYDIARSGGTVTIEPREVQVHRLEVAAFDPPHLSLEIECSSGTYIRAIGRDLGSRLQCGAVMTQLERTSIGPFHVSEACDPSSFTRVSLRKEVLSPLMGLPEHAVLNATENEATDIRYGRAIVIPEPGDTDAGRRIVAVDPQLQLIALGEWRSSTGRFHPTLVFEALH